MRKIMLTVLITMLASCGTVQKKKESPSDSVISKIESINKKPDFVRANVSVNITMERMSSISVAGVAYLQNDPLKVRVKLNEPIFKSTVMDLLADNERVTIHFPIDKKAQIIRGGLNKETFNGLIDSRLFIAYAITCNVPMIPDYSVSDYRIVSKNRTVLVIENSEMLQEIDFYDDTVKKVVITDKNTSKKYTVIYSRMFDQDGYTFFKSITAYISGTNEKVTVYYGRINSNPKFNSNSIFNISIPKGTAIIR